MTTIKLFPILVAASKFSDYTIVVCPDIVERPYYIAKATVELKDLEKNTVINKSVVKRSIISPIDEANIVYTYEQILDENNVPIVDLLGRRPYMFYGYILSANNSIDLTSELLSKIKFYLKPKLNEFLSKKNFSEPFRVSEISINLDSSSDPLKISNLEVVQVERNIFLKSFRSKQELITNTNDLITKESKKNKLNDLLKKSNHFEESQMNSQQDNHPRMNQTNTRLNSITDQQYFVIIIILLFIILFFSIFNLFK